MAYSAVALASLTYGVIQGERGSQNQKKGIRLQKEAQDRAEARAVRQENSAAEQRRRESARVPDIGAMLTQEQSLSGVSSLLSGAGGVAPGRLKLGRPTLLGG